MIGNELANSYNSRGAILETQSRDLPKEAAERLRKALAELPDAQREAFILKQEAGLSLAEVASVLVHTVVSVWLLLTGYTIMAPVYITPETLRSSFDILPPVEVSNTGKIYLYEKYILLNEPGKGIRQHDRVAIAI